MKISTLTNKIIACLFVILFWHILSKIYPPVIVPTVSQVWEGIRSILTDASLLIEIVRTIGRLFIGFILGVILSIIFSILISRFKIFGGIVYPIVEFLQVVPPISWLILAILWLGLNGKPSIMIVTISIFCIMTISLVNSIDNINRSGKYF